MPASTPRKKLLILVIAVCIVAAAWARVEIFLQHEATRDLAPFVGKDRVVEGKVINDPERRETTLHAHVWVEAVDGAEARGTLLVILPREAELHFGDTVRAAGEVALPQTFETDTGRLFDYPSYLRVRGISATMRYAELEVVAHSGWSARGTLFALKHAFERSLRTLLPEPDVSLMEGILLGERRGIPEDLNQALIVVGLIHIVVLSGYNVSIVAEQFLRFFGLFLSQRAALALGAMAIVGFALMVGAGATVVRATLMGLIAIVARVLGRPGAALRALGVAAVAMALWNPLVVLYDPSFILSVLATFGLITLSHAVEKRIGFVPERAGLRSIVASTIAVQIYILPALLYMTGILSAFALFANALVLPLVPLVMLAGFVAGVLGLVHTAVALPFAVVAHVLIEWVAGVSVVVAGLPFSATIVAAFPVWVALAAYVPLTLFAIYCYRTSSPPRSSSNF